MRKSVLPCLRRWKYCADVDGNTTCQFTSSPSTPVSLESLIWRKRSILK